MKTDTRKQPVTVNQVTPQGKRRKPTAKATTNRLRTELVKTKLTPDEKHRFDALQQASGLSQAEFVRRACLRQRNTVVPDQNLTQYATLGQLQRVIQTVLQGELPAASREQLEAALETLKTTRLLLVDVDPQATGSALETTEGETAATRSTA